MDRRAIFPNKLLPYALVAPQIVITAVFFFWPALKAIQQSLYKEDPFGLSSRFVGFANYNLVLNDSSYRNAVEVTAVFSIAVTLITMAVALFLAVLTENIVRGRGFYRTLIMMPYAIAPAVAGMLWLFMFNPSMGTLAVLLNRVGAGWDPLLNGGQALVLVIVASSWKQISYTFLFYAAALQSIPKTLVEEADLDGANAWQKFRFITLPLLSPTSFFLLVVNLIYAFFDTFGIIHAVTGGGPGRATETLVFKVYNDGFVNQQIGPSAAQSVILIAVVSLLTFAQFRFIERKVHYA
jgi:sn-glycerol 3-phosphate transport system permease protein